MLEIFGAPTHTSRLICAKYGLLEYTHGVHGSAKFHLIRCFSSPLRSEKPPILQFFNFVIPWWLRPALQRQSWTWVHIYKHIQRYQGRFRIPKRSWQSGVHELFKSVMYKKSNKKHRTFSFPGGALYPSPTKPGIVIVEFCTLLAPQNTFASNA